MTWQFWLDVGGTFTDCLARRPDGALLRRKVLSSGVVKGQATIEQRGQVVRDAAHQEPAGFWCGYGLRILETASGQAAEAIVVDFHGGSFVLDQPVGGGGQWGQGERLAAVNYELVSPEDAPVLAIRLFLGLALDQPIPPCMVRLGTTRGTNALLTRRGAATGFVTTRGLGDLLHIGYQNRPNLFELAIRKPTPLFSAIAEIDERIAPDGSILTAIQPQQVRAELTRLRSMGIESLAICLLNAYSNPLHERQIEHLAREVGFEEISVSSQISPLMKVVPRGDTTVVDAYLNPVLRQYVLRLSAALPGSDLRLMTSAGGLVGPAAFTGKDSILSGPAGGVVGFSRVAQAAGFTKAIGFDMGGTSTDVARFDGRFEHEYETEKAGVRIVAPMLAIETVAAGGGSICRWDGIKLVVGPESAGADPGPACYGRGGPLTITDCNLLLGRILPEHFPFPLDREAAQARLNDLAQAAGNQPDSRELAAGLVRIANANMAQAIRRISVAKGVALWKEYALVAFGSAAAQHACAIAQELSMKSVVIHPDAGILSALGIGLADVVKHQATGIYCRLDPQSLADARAALDKLEAVARAEVAAEGVPAERITVQRRYDLRYLGTDLPLAITEPADGRLSIAFAHEHKQRFGYYRDQPLELVAVRTIATGRAAQSLPAATRGNPRGCPLPDDSREIYFDRRMWPADVFTRDKLACGDQLRGPALVVDALTTTVIDPGWEAEVLSGGELLLKERSGSIPEPPLEATQQLAANDPVRLELTCNRFTSIATEMGIRLRSTASSVNVKERLDFSCAIFSKTGDLIVNAPHIPVHLGAMADTVKRIIADQSQFHSTDSFITNDPYRGGSHLPDVTVVSPVLFDDGKELAFFVASRAHHAEIGGITPGSMPPFSKNLAEEGVLIRCFNYWPRASEWPRVEELRKLLTAGVHPTRSVETNIADIGAQHSANSRGQSLLESEYRESFAWVESVIAHLQAATERKLRAALAKLPPGRREFVDHLDDGTPICVAVTIHGNAATIDFTRTGSVLPGNLNANRAIVNAAVMYVLRLLIGEDIPLNQGVLAPVEIVLPECLLNPPERERPEDCAAIVGGNVETSQRVVDVLLGAFGLAAASQGTMNNVLFGDSTFGYYETICGGSGATATAHGADAVHTHMTNTRLTDPEVLEARYPVRLLEFAIRRGSGGGGQFRGGDGVRRRIEFLKPLTLSILSQRRGPYPPYGMHGGEPGALGKNTLRRVDGTVVALPALAQVDVQPGDILTIETPGGGGWGAMPAGE